MDEFPANSHVRREVAKTVGSEKPVVEPKVIEKITTGEVIQRKRPLGRRLAETFFGGTAKSAVNYVFMEVLIPAAKDAVSDAVSQGIERILFGEGRSPSGRRSFGRNDPARNRNGYVSYSQFSSPSRRPTEEARPLSRRARETHNFNEILLNSRAEARDVLFGMKDIIDRYDVCSLSDLYKLVGIVPQFTDEKWGWTDINDAREVRTRDGRYLLDLPPPESIEQ